MPLKFYKMCCYFCYIDSYRTLELFAILTAFMIGIYLFNSLCYNIYTLYIKKLCEDITIKNMKHTIEQALAQFIENDTRNVLAAHNNMKIYDAPLIGYAEANDALFASYTNAQIIGPEFMQPQAWLPGAKTVVSYFMPFAREIRESNRKVGLPSEEWVSARIDGEVFNNAVRTYLVSFFEARGAAAVAPAIDPRFAVRELVPNWSERHAAYASGLGTFGLQRALITDKGTAGRFGSVVTTLELAPTTRPYTGIHENCLFYAKGTCGACIKRCPPGVITPQGKDNKACSAYIDANVLPLFAPRYGCGKCNTAVPCEYASPV